MEIKAYVSDTQAIDLIATMFNSGQPVSLLHIAGCVRSAGRDIPVTAD